MRGGAAAFIALASTVAFAQEKARPEGLIETDRPDFTEATSVVPSRWFQIETGLTHRWSPGERRTNGPEALMRYGISSRAEIRVGLPDFNFVSDRGRRFSGLGDASLGAKIGWDSVAKGTDLCVIPAVFLPSGNEDFSSRSIDPDLKVCVSRGWGAGWSLSAMAHGQVTTIDDRRTLQFEATASLGHDLTKRLKGFVEYAGVFSRSNLPEHVAHAGLAYRLSHHSQIDLHGGVTSEGGSPGSFVAGGYSFRF